MRPVRISSSAEADLESIADFIAKNNPQRAVSFVRELEGRCRKIGNFPDSARKIEGLGRDIRSVHFKGYVIVYRSQPGSVMVERIWQGSRDIRSLLESI